MKAIEYGQTVNYIRVKQEAVTMIEATKGVRQGCIPSPLLFLVVVNELIKNTKTQAKQHNKYRALENARGNNI